MKELTKLILELKKSLNPKQTKQMDRILKILLKELNKIGGSYGSRR